MDAQPLKILGIAIFCAALSACGGGDDPVTASDSGANDNAGSNDSGNATGNDDSAGGSGGERQGGGPDLADGTLLVATAGDSVTGEFPCKLELFDGTQVTSETAVTRTLAFDPSTLALSVDGEVMLQGSTADSSWGYINQSSEYESSSTTDAAGSLNEVYGKIFYTGAPAYFRSKVTAADFSYEQLECYQGLTVE